MSTVDLGALARPHVPALHAPARLRAAALATWRARMVNEYASGRVFEALARHLAQLGMAEESAEALQFAREERRHGVLWRRCPFARRRGKGRALRGARVSRASGRAAACGPPSQRD